MGYEVGTHAGWQYKDPNVVEWNWGRAPSVNHMTWYVFPNYFAWVQGFKPDDYQIRFFEDGIYCLYQNSDGQAFWQPKNWDWI